MSADQPANLAPSTFSVSIPPFLILKRRRGEGWGAGGESPVAANNLQHPREEKKNTLRLETTEEEKVLHFPRFLGTGLINAN